MIKIDIFKILKNSVFQNFKKEVQVCLGDLKFGADGNDGIWGDKKRITIDRNNILIDGNHRVYKMLNEKGPKHKIKVEKWIIPSWSILLFATIVTFVRWVRDWTKSLYSSKD